MMGWENITTLIFSGLVTIATMVYAILTAILVKETRRLREVQTEPNMAVFFKCQEEFFNVGRLIFKNIGLGPAYKISFEITPINHTAGENILLEEFSSAEFISRGLEYLGPNQEVVSGYTMLTEDFEGKINAMLLVKIKYQSALGKKYESCNQINLSELKGLTVIGKPSLYSIATSLEKIQRDFGHLASGFRKLKVDIFTKKDRDLEDKRRKQLDEDLKRRTSELSPPKNPSSNESSS